MTSNLPATITEQTLSLQTLEFGTSAVQPVADVATYLATRLPQSHYRDEKGLLITLPAKVQEEVKALVRACHFVSDLVKDGSSVQAACKSALRIYREWGWNLNTFRQKYDAWAKAKDWVVLVNRSKAPVAWRETSVGLPESFLKYAEERFASFRREDGKRQAVLSLHRQWKTGRNETGEVQPVPGYIEGWSTRDTENVPVGWSYDNICDQLTRRARFTKGVRALLHDSESAARAHLPQILASRAGMKFMEEVTFDDLRFDYLIFNPETGQAEELWALIARESSCRLVLGGVLHPATVREDGRAAHLGARHMKELAGYLLQTYPLPPYAVTWKVERGTATLREGVKLALGELFNDRIKVSYTMMIGDRSPVGYKEKAKGNSRGKAIHEAPNRLYHTQASFLPGQTGARYDIRPADLEARCEEARQIWQRAQSLPEHLRAGVKYPLKTPAEARKWFNQFSLDQNFRTDHQLEGFDEVLEFLDPATSRWQLVTEGHAGTQLRKRMESPVERAVRKIREVARWDRVSPELVITFLDHTQRPVKVEANGEIKFTHEGRVLVFRNGGNPLSPQTKALAYFNPQDPQFIHLTSGDGRVLGTWAMRGRVAYQDQEALAQAMRYTHAAREQAKATAAELAAPQRAVLDDMRTHNAELEKFITVTDAPTATGIIGDSLVGAVMRTIKTTAGEMKVNPPPVEPVKDCTDDLLKRADESPAPEDEHWD